MSTLQDRERELYSGLWSSVQAYGEHAPGEKYLPLFLQMVGEKRGTVLDAGTGSGKGALALKRAGFTVVCCDLTDDGLIPEAKALPFKQACLWHDLHHVVSNFQAWGRSRVQHVYCCDVLEHIPPQFTMLAIEQMLRVTGLDGGLFLAVSLVPDSFGAWVGESLHQTVQPFTWWRDSIAEIGQILESRDLVSNAVFFVRPR